MAGWTGVGRYTVGLARALRRRHDVELVAIVDPSGDVPESLEGIEQIPSVGHPFSIEGGRGLARALGTSAPDVVHCAHFPTPIPASHPLVVTLHDLTPLVVPGIMPSALRRMVYRRLNVRAARVADRIITPSSHTKADVERLIPVARGKTRVTLEAADDFATGPIDQLEGALGDLASDPYLLSMGSTRPHKDLPTLLTAFATFARLRPDIRLLLVGPEQRDYVAEHLPGVPDAIRARVTFTGRVSDGTLRALYASAAAFVFPSRYEGFGLPPLEAMAMGAPVVVARAASLPEVVGEAALMFEPGDARALTGRLEELMSDDQLRRGLVTAGLARSGELTWAATAAATAAVYREVLDP